MLEFTSMTFIFGMIGVAFTGLLHYSIMAWEVAWVTMNKASSLYAADERYLDDFSSHSRVPDDDNSLSP